MERALKLVPAGLRAVIGGAIGLAVGRLVVVDLEDRVADRWWPSWAAAATLAIAFAAAPSVGRLSDHSVVAGLGLATAIGLYLAVAETDHVLGIGVGLAVLVVAELRGRLGLDTLITMAVDVALVWAALRGAANRPAAVVAGLALLGLLLVAPLVVAGRRPTTPLRRAALVDPLLVAAQLVFAIVVARNGALRSDAAAAALVAGAGLVALIVAGRLVVARQPW